LLIALACGVQLQAVNPPAAATPNPAPAALAIQTATTHPMKYFVSVPGNWSANRKWPVLVAPSAHYDNQGRSFTLFVRQRDARKSDFIIVSPFVINADPISGMPEYRGAVANAINAADAAATEGTRDEDARARFDSEGVRAVIKDVQQLYRGEDKVFITGFSSSTHVAYLFLFTHPELLKGVVINSGVYLGRGVDENHLPLVKSPERAQLEIKFIVGERDNGCGHYLENWAETKTQLIRCGHPEPRIQMEVIKPGNAENLSPGHNWFHTRILDFCTAVETAAAREK
jgi:hypothetical protein